MSKGEPSSVTIKSEPYNNDVHNIYNKIKVENEIFVETKPTVDLEYIKEDMKEESLMEVKQEEITLKDEIASSSDDTHNDLTNDAVITEGIELSATSLNTETSSSTGEKRFPFTLCQYKTSRKQELKLHCHTREKAASNAKFRCAKCEYETSKKRLLKRHMMTHTGEKPFACNLCKFRTARTGNLKRHIMNHTGEKPFPCNLCEFRTAHKHKGTFSLHMMTHTGEKPFACNLCDFRTVRKVSLVNHMMAHTDAKPFTCNLCEFKSFNKTHLKIHMTMTKHPGQGEFKITRSSNLKVYKRKHTSEKPFVYNASKKDVEYHNIKTHTDGKQHDTNLCEFKKD